MLTGFQGPAIFYVDSDGTRLRGDLFSVGSGSTFAYGVLDQGYRWDLTDEEAHELGRRSIYAAGHRDAFSGNTCNLYHVKEHGWEFIGTCSVSQIIGIMLTLPQATMTLTSCTTRALAMVKDMAMTFGSRGKHLLLLLKHDIYHCVVVVEHVSNMCTV